MARKAKDVRRREFGTVRQLPSGRWQVRYSGPGRHPPAEHRRRSRPRPTRNTWLTLTKADIERKDWTDPDGGAVNFEEYALRWVDERKLAATTDELYRRLLPAPHPPHVPAVGPRRDHPASGANVACRAAGGDRRHDGREGVPAAEGHPPDGGRRRVDPPQPLPDQGRGQGGGGGAADRHASGRSTVWPMPWARAGG